jgi:hypothetical protein
MYNVHVISQRTPPLAGVNLGCEDSVRMNLTHHRGATTTCRGGGVKKKQI